MTTLRSYHHGFSQKSCTDRRWRQTRFDNRHWSAVVRHTYLIHDTSSNTLFHRAGEVENASAVAMLYVSASNHPCFPLTLVPFRSHIDIHISLPGNVCTFPLVLFDPKLIVDLSSSRQASAQTPQIRIGFHCESRRSKLTSKSEQSLSPVRSQRLSSKI